MSNVFAGTNEYGFGGYELTDQILYNLKWWLDWSLLWESAFDLYRRSDESFLSTDESTLLPVFDERFNEGRVWNGVGGSWAWESGVEVAGDDPFRASGVYVDNVFYPLDTTGGLAHNIDYQHGRILFDNAVNPDSLVQAEYTSRRVHVAFADDPDFRVLIQRSISDQLTDSLPSGTPPKEHQIHLPAIFIEEKGGSGRGWQLGGGQIKTRELVFHIFAEHPGDRNLLMDWLDKQTRTTFTMADLNLLTFPLDEYGSVVDRVTNWPDMATDYPFKKLMVLDGRKRRLDSINPTFFRGRVEWEVEIFVGGI